jgi:signal peptidase I
MSHSPLGSTYAPDRAILPRTCNASDVGSRAINDTIPERGVCANANEERHSDGQHVAMGVYSAVQKRAKARTRNDSYFPVGFSYLSFLYHAFSWAAANTNNILIYSSPANPSHIAIKRVIGLPGDRITTREPCLRQTQIVPWNHVWLEGDAEDPRKTLDSNTYGPVSLSLITGQVFAVLGPRMRWLKWTDWESNKGDDGAVNSYGQSVRDRVLKDAVKLEQPLMN